MINCQSATSNGYYFPQEFPGPYHRWPDPEDIQKIGSADLVIGILDPPHAGDAPPETEAARAALAGIPAVRKAVVLCRNGHHPEVEREPGEFAEIPAVFQYHLPAPPTAETPLEGMARAYRSVLEFGEKLEARACCIVASPAGSHSAAWIRRLAQPVLELGFDLVAPRYTRHKMEGLLNRAILSPWTLPRPTAA